MDLKLWVLSGVLTLIVPLLFWAIKSGLSAILKQLQAITAELNSIRLSLATTTQDIRYLKERGDDHEKRIRHLEQKP